MLNGGVRDRPADGERYLRGLFLHQLARQHGGSDPRMQHAHKLEKQAVTPAEIDRQRHGTGMLYKGCRVQRPRWIGYAAHG